SQSTFSLVLHALSSLIRSVSFSFFHCYCAHLSLHSFPTRRSSDLTAVWTPSSWSRALPTCAASAHCSAAMSPWSSGPKLHRWGRSEEHTSELQSRGHLVCRLLLEKKKKKKKNNNDVHSRHNNKEYI